MNDSTNQIEEESRIRSAAFNLTETSGVGMLVFDCDGTIFPYVEELHAKSVAAVIEEASKKVGIGYSDSIFEAQWEQELGKGIQNFFEQYYAYSVGANEKPLFMGEIRSFGNALTLYEKKYIELAQKPENAHFFKIRNGLLAVFAAAAQAKVPMAVLSNANECVLRQSLETGLIQADLGYDSLTDIFAAIVGKDMVENDGHQAKPDPSAVLSVKKRVEAAIGVLISLPNSIGFGDTPADYNAFKNSGFGRVVACKNSWGAHKIMVGPDENGFVTIGLHHDVCETLALFQKYQTGRHHDPYLCLPHQ
ncbi:MAG: HAD family hydrolase [Alphaproteobacteria bacterium]|nr:HAD family hydrolase [Alphaproteobacteria bacterium]MCB9984093.1 HAD family hydrolase [Micavibrio sp.]